MPIGKTGLYYPIEYTESTMSIPQWLRDIAGVREMTILMAPMTKTYRSEYSNDCMECIDRKSGNSFTYNWVTRTIVG